MRETIDRVLMELGVPASRMRDVLLELAALTEEPERPGDAAAASAALSAAMGYIRLMYETVSPLQEQLDELRARAIIRAMEREDLV